MTQAPPKQLVVDMRLALLAEFGACAIYARLARQYENAPLGGVLQQLHADEGHQIEKLRALMTALGARPKARSLRRVCAAALLAGSARLGARSLALRLCYESEATVARWYDGYARYLREAGNASAARTCDELAFTKVHHAALLSAWVAH